MRVKFVKNGYETEMNDELAKIYLKKKKVEAVEEKKKTGPKPKDKDEDK